MKVIWPLMVRKIQGHSMVPVLPPGTYIYGWKWFLRLKPGQVVVFDYNDKESIKRIDVIEDSGIFVLGDHPETSNDSRHYGLIPRHNVTAVVIWPRTHKVEAQTLEQAKREVFKP